MWLLRAWRTGEIEPSPRLAEIFYSCVTCGNCVEHCALEFKEDLVKIFIEAREEIVDATAANGPRGLASRNIPDRNICSTSAASGRTMREEQRSHAPWRPS